MKNDELVKDEALTIFLAGHDTTANALSWTWYLVGQHPEVEAKLVEEGKELSIITYGMGVHWAKKAIDEKNEVELKVDNVFKLIKTAKKVMDSL